MYKYRLHTFRDLSVGDVRWMFSGNDSSIAVIRCIRVAPVRFEVIAEGDDTVAADEFCAMRSKELVCS